MDHYCRNFVENIFLKHDDNRNNVLERRELKKWVREELKGHKYLNRKMVQKGFEDFFRQVDTNNDNKIDRWELYDYCIKNIEPSTD
jgi:Ca2+-binding EF-hand superfamily protein